ncbi:MAG: aldo/keto reductase [Deltaproteobacteria bacterium]|nr:aldo/keto reductase [Deltaproteobacteria bacterium]
MSRRTSPAVSARRRLGRTSVEVTRLGFGSAALGNLYDVIDDTAATATVTAALDAGVGYFDTAPFYGYGLSEQRLGCALASSAHEEVVLSSKVGRLLTPRTGPARSDQGFVGALPFDPVFDYSYDGVMQSVEASLRRLSRSRIDILLLHDVGAQTHGKENHTNIFEIAMSGGYVALDELRRAGDIGAVGLGVNETAVCLEAMERGDFDCFLLAGRYTLLEQNALDDLLPACLEREISIIIGGPYNSGILAEGPRSGAHYDYVAASSSMIDRVKSIRAICRMHEVPLAAAALQFPLRHSAVATVIPGARTEKEVHESAEWIRHPIPENLWSDLVEAGLLDPRSLLSPPTGGSQ